MVFMAYFTYPSAMSTIKSTAVEVRCMDELTVATVARLVISAA